MTTQILKTISIIPDELQNDRIAEIMNCRGKSQNNEFGIGFLSAPQEIQPNSRRYNQDTRYVYEMYTRALQDLASMSPPVKRWLQAHRDSWQWMVHDVAREDAVSRQPARVDYSRRDDARNATPVMDGYGQSDSDMFAPESDEEEDEYDDEVDRLFGNDVHVQGAGLDVVNGVYKMNGRFDSVGKYTRMAPWQDQTHEFSLFRCNTSNGAKHWYISIVPLGVQPGTSTDIDFYSAHVSQQEPNYPPETGWTAASEGKAPPPTVTMPYEREPAFEMNDLDKQQWGDGTNRNFQA